MSLSQVVVEVPGSTANLGPGLDSVGLALDLWNRYEFRISGPGVRIQIEGAGADFLPKDETHPGYAACVQTLEEWGIAIPGLEIRQSNRVPFSGGLGNSATAVVAGVLAAAQLAGRSMSQDELLQATSKIEGHPDNVAPAIFGGLVVSVTDENSKPVYVRVPVPENLVAVVAVPDFALRTLHSRQVLPKELSLHDAIYNLGRTGLLVASVATGDLSVLGEAMKDRLHQNFRSPLVPGLLAVTAAAEQAGALGAALSGSGPSVVAFCERGADGERIGEAMVQAFAKSGVKSSAIAVNPSPKGVAVERTNTYVR